MREKDEKKGPWDGRTPTDEELEQILKEHREWWEGLSADTKNTHHLLDEQFTPPHDLRGINLGKRKIPNLFLTGANLKGADFSKSQFEHGSFRIANLSSTNMNESVLSAAIFIFADISCSNLTSATIRNLNTHGADFRRNCLNKQVSDIANSNDFRYAKFHESYLTEANLAEVDNLSPANLAGAVLREALLPPGFDWALTRDSPAKAAGYARKIFTPLLAASALLFLVSLGIISKPAVAGMEIANIHIAWAGPIVLTIVYVYFLNYMNRLFESLAALPAVFPDGSEVYRHPDPWFLANFVRLHTYQLRPEVKRYGPDGPNQFKTEPGPTPVAARIAAGLIWWPVPLALAGTTLGFVRLGKDWITGLNLVFWMVVVYLSQRSYFEAVTALRTVNGRGLEKAKEPSGDALHRTLIIIFLVMAIVLGYRGQPGG